MNEMNRRQFCRTTAAGAAGLTLAGAGWAAAAKPVQPRRPVTVFTKCLQFLEFDELGEVLAEVGFDGADLAVRPGGQVSPENVETELPRAFKALKKAGVAIPMMVTSIDNADDPVAEKILKSASKLGITHYRMGWIAYDEKKPITENLENFKVAFAKLEKLNRKYHIRGEYQNHAGRRLGGPVWDLHPLLQSLDPEFIGVQYDVRHATVEGGNSWLLGMRLVAPWIGTTDIKDFIWEKDARGAWRARTVPLGEGMVDWKTYFTEYQKLNVAAPVSIHYEYDLGGAESGSKTPKMPLPEIKKWLKKDLLFLKTQFNQYQL